MHACMQTIEYIRVVEFELSKSKSPSEVMNEAHTKIKAACGIHDRLSFILAATELFSPQSLEMI